MLSKALISTILHYILHASWYWSCFIYIICMFPWNIWRWGKICMPIQPPEVLPSSPIYMCSLHTQSYMRWCAVIYSLCQQIKEELEQTWQIIWLGEPGLQVTPCEKITPSNDISQLVISHIIYAETFYFLALVDSKLVTIWMKLLGKYVIQALSKRKSLQNVEYIIFS